MSKFKLATFRADVTPPVGHPLCAGWHNLALGVTDPMFVRALYVEHEGERASENPVTHPIWGGKSCKSCLRLLAINPLPRSPLLRGQILRGQV